jgi:protein-S-isoprenylcysteine O-methyltransferase Ste14
MKPFFKRVIISLVPPIIFVIGFPIVAVLTHDIDSIPWLSGAPLLFVASAIGILLIAFGLMLALKTIPLFHKLSEGTIMPWEPANELIVEGVYRYVRNPMHTGVFAVMLGEGLVLRSTFILTFALFAIFSHLFYIPFSEERGLEKRFGETYRVYKENVPRWIPRSTPWEPRDT